MPKLPRQRTISKQRRVVPGTEYLTKSGKPSGVCLLTNPSKMPGLSWSLPAVKSCPFRVKTAGSICANCFAQKGRYIMPCVVNAQAQRYAWTLACLKSDTGQDTWVETLTDAIRALGDTYFRVHDSGDLFSPAYTRMWLRVCHNLPEVRFWFPTQSYRGPWADVIRELAALPNVTVRPSGETFDSAPVVVPGLAAGSSASATDFNCPAHFQGNNCGACRLCWDAPELPIVYRKH